MSFQVRVQLKGADDVFSPTQSKEDAEADLRKIRDVLGARDPMKAQMGVPDVTWMTAQGHNIVGAGLIEVEEDQAGALRLS